MMVCNVNYPLLWPYFRLVFLQFTQNPVVRGVQFGAMGIHIPVKWGAIRSYQEFPKNWCDWCEMTWRRFIKKAPLETMLDVGIVHFYWVFQGLVNVLFFSHHPTIGDIISKRYTKVVSKISNYWYIYQPLHHRMVISWSYWIGIDYIRSVLI